MLTISACKGFNTPSAITWALAPGQLADTLITLIEKLGNIWVRISKTDHAPNNIIKTRHKFASNRWRIKSPNIP